MNHRIPIDEVSRIRIENNNYVLELKLRENKRWVVDGYFPTLDSLLQDWVHNAPVRHEKSLKSLQEVVDIIQAAEAKMVKLIHNYQNTIKKTLE